MPPIEVGTPRAIGAVTADIARKANEARTSAPANPTSVPSPAIGPSSGSVARPAVETSAALAAGQEPVDTDRVSQIRKAVESGTYPLVPTRIADALIAAGILLRTGKA